jgi:hypothetical protein
VGGKKGNVELEFVVTERLARLREEIMNRKILGRDISSAREEKMSTLIEALKARIANPDTASELRDAAISQLRTLAANSDDRRSADALSILRELGVEFDPEPPPASSNEPKVELSEAEEFEKFRSWSIPEGRKYFQRLFPCPHSLPEQDERLATIRNYFELRITAAERARDETLRRKLVGWRSSGVLDAVM